MRKRQGSKPHLPKDKAKAETRPVGAKPPPAEAQQKVVMERFSALFAGPLPTPAMYREYESILPGSAERIMAMAEKEQDARIEKDNNNQMLALKIKACQNTQGQLCALVVALSCIGAATYVALRGHTSVAISLAAITAIGVVGHFIRQKTGSSGLS